MQRVKGRRKQTSGSPGNRLRHAVPLLDFRDALALDDVNDFFIEVALRLKGAPRRDPADVDSGDALKAAELEIGPLAAQPFPSFERDFTYIGDAVAFNDRDTLFLHPALVVGSRPRDPKLYYVG